MEYKLDIIVTKDDILQSQRKLAETLELVEDYLFQLYWGIHCPVSCALKRLFPGFKVYTGPNFIYLENNKLYEFSISRAGRKFIRDFDSGEDIVPVKFKIELKDGE